MIDEFLSAEIGVYCKSGGTTKFSRYAQVAIGVETVKAHPLIGLAAEFNTRLIEWLAFHFGGPAGRAAFSEHPPHRRRDHQLADRRRIAFDRP